MILMGSVQLANASDHDGQGTADAAGISLSASVIAVGTAIQRQTWVPGC